MFSQVLPGPPRRFRFPPSEICLPRPWLGKHNLHACPLPAIQEHSGSAAPTQADAPGFIGREGTEPVVLLEIHCHAQLQYLMHRMGERRARLI